MLAAVVDTSTSTGWPILDNHITDIGEEPSPSHLGRRGVIMQSENKYYRPIIGTFHPSQAWRADIKHSEDV